MKHVFEDIAYEAVEMFEIAMLGSEDERRRPNCDPMIVEALLQYAQEARKLAVIAQGRARE